MQQKRDLAIVLRSVAYEERHRIITALTENHGLISALARNSIQSKRFGGALEPFAASMWLFVERHGADLYRVEEAHIRRPFEGIRKDFERLSMASAFNELMLKVAPEREPCPELFRLHSNALAAIEDMPGVGVNISVLNAFLAKVLQWSGSQPRLQNCLSCEIFLDDMENPEGSVSCVVSSAGWICSSCRVGETLHIQKKDGQKFDHSLLRVTPAAIRDFHISLNLPIRQIADQTQASPKEHRELFQFLEALMVYHLPGFDRKPLKSLRFLDLQSSVSAN